MAIKLGDATVTLRLGTQSVTGYLGSAIVTATVPGAPTITSAIESGPEIEVRFSAPESNGGSPITSYVFYVNGLPVTPSEANEGLAYLPGGSAGDSVEVAAVNAIGEGPKSAPVAVT